jgi:hypothetical protein
LLLLIGYLAAAFLEGVIRTTPFLTTLFTAVLEKLRMAREKEEEGAEDENPPHPCIFTTMDQAL